MITKLERICRTGDTDPAAPMDLMLDNTHDRDLSDTWQAFAQLLEQAQANRPFDNQSVVQKVLDSHSHSPAAALPHAPARPQFISAFLCAATVLLVTCNLVVSSNGSNAMMARRTPLVAGNGQDYTADWEDNFQSEASQLRDRMEHSQWRWSSPVDSQTAPLRSAMLQLETQWSSETL